MFVKNKAGHVHSVPDSWKEPQRVDQFGKALLPSRLEELALTEASKDEVAAWKARHEPAPQEAAGVAK